MNHAVFYVLIGVAGVVLSILLMIGISRKSYQRILPWIVFQLVNIFYQAYFSFEVVRSSRYEISRWSSMVILMIFIFHIIFESYYLCLIIGLSQVIANINVIGIPEVEMSPFQDVQLREVVHSDTQSVDDARQTKQ